jgi:Protein prenyltransferase alpha subunit repeat
MHGRRRAEHKALQRDPQIAAKLAKKASLWCRLQTELLRRRREKIYLSETLELIDNALSVNPDPLWLWNFRREFFLVAVASEESSSAAVTGSSATDDCFDWEREAAVTQSALENNPKAYGAWHHRKWSLCRQQQIQQQQQVRVAATTSADDDDGSIVLESELLLTASFLQRDERNFHCWSYRRFVVSLLLHGPVGMGAWQIMDDTDGAEHLMMGAQIGGGGGHHYGNNNNKKEEENHPPLLPNNVNHPLPNNAKALSILEAEWNFTDEKIRDNFSNCSAIHYRSKLLVILHKDVNTEMTTIVNNAICTEPDDQTAWWYQSFLLQYAAAASSSEETYGGDNVATTPLLLNEKVLNEHIALLRELQDEMENQSKWVLLGLLNALSFRRRSDNSNHAANTEEEQRAILQRLATTVDPDRRMRYLRLLRDLAEQNKK